MATENGRLTRIGVFYDGGYFQAVSDYYKFQHERRARISVRGLHEFAAHRVATEEAIDARYCRVIDAHYFRGRFSAHDAAQANRLEQERLFDDILMRENVVTHYLPRSLRLEEKGIDVWFALEAYELAVYKRFDVLVLVACDGDYLPLIRKLHTLHTRVMLFAWDFEYTDAHGKPRWTRTAQSLINEATYPVMMHDLIDSRSQKDRTLIDRLFVRPTTSAPGDTGQPAKETQLEPAEGVAADRQTGKIESLNTEKYFGIVRCDDGQYGTQLFLGTEVRSPTFEDLNEGDAMSFALVQNPQKPGQMMAANVVRSSGS
ncbi:MAG: NYN domain-containing protein [Planctomycetota bacterium]